MMELADDRLVFILNYGYGYYLLDVLGWIFSAKKVWHICRVVRK